MNSSRANARNRSGGIGAHAESKQHEHVSFWKKFATGIGHNKTVEGLHFQSEAELRAMLTRAGFTDIQVAPTSDRDSNVLVTAMVAAPK